MNNKNRFFIIGLILLVLFTVSAVSANENATETIAEDNLNDYVAVENDVSDANKVGTSDFDDEYDQVDVSIANYKKSYNYGDTVKIKATNNGKPCSNNDIDVNLDNVYGGLKYYGGTTSSNGVFSFKLKGVSPGSYEVSGYVDGYYYSVNKLIKVNKIPVKIYANKCTGTTAYTILKAVVKDKNGKLVDFGSVKFKINGKTYIANINNGVAKKKISLTNARTYTYKVYPYKYISGKASSSKVVVKQSYVKVTTISCKTNVARYATLTAIVKHSNGRAVDGGFVLFKINGKSYISEVNYGLAVEKIKLSANTYTYTAIFLSKCFKSKSTSSKIVVSNIMVKRGKYVFWLNAAQYNKIKYIKNHKYSGERIPLYFNVKTNQYYNGLPVHVFFYSYNGRLNGVLTNLVRYQFVAMPNNNPHDWIYITGRYVF